ncbi:solute carrier family 22 member 15-like [Bolinopsis microptera]|uniref:solute carrier family 22 member 15-like n=1 Tax=Bolinopsis microptera TaxID=2820187 RepID=UPI003079E1B4
MVLVEVDPIQKNQKNQRGIDDLIEELVRHRAWKYTFLVLSICITQFYSSTSAYLTSFAGIDPEPGDIWSCKSEKCKSMTTANPTLLEEFPCDITKIVDGNVELVFEPSDIIWHLERTSFSAEFDLYCDVGSRSARKTLVASMFFVGSLFGLIVGGYAWDHIGRVRAAMFAICITIVAHLLGTWCHNYGFLLAIRFFTGFGDFMTYTGTYILQMELTSVKYRTLVNALVCNLHVFVFLIESPRFHLVNNDMEAAKKSLKALAALTTANLDVDGIEIIDTEKVNAREQTAIQQLKDLWTYPVLLKEGLCLVPLWFFITLFYYGFNFACDMILPWNLYSGYLMAAVGETIACLITIPVVQWMGRRRAMIIFQILSALVFLIAVADVDLGNDWGLDSVCSLVGLTIVTGNFYNIYLWTSELAPTSHRGFAFTIGSGAAKFGGFAGPYIFNNLGPATTRAVPWILLAVLSLLCALAAFFLVESADKAIVNVPEEVKERRKDFRYMI